MNERMNESATSALRFHSTMPPPPIVFKKWSGFVPAIELRRRRLEEEGTWTLKKEHRQEPVLPDQHNMLDPNLLCRINLVPLADIVHHLRLLSFREVEAEMREENFSTPTTKRERERERKYLRWFDSLLSHDKLLPQDARK